MPIEPVQILWVNLVVAIALALPLAFEAQEPGLMQRLLRPPNEPLLSPFLVFRTFLVGALMTAGAVGLFPRGYTADLLAGVPADLARVESQTVVVTTIILFQMLYLLNCRSLTQTFWRIGLFSNWWVYIGMLATLGNVGCGGAGAGGILRHLAGEVVLATEARQQRRAGVDRMTFVVGFFSRRWRGQVPLPVLLWRDMLGVGTVVNLTATILALAVMVQDGPDGLAVALHFLPMPYNVFLFAALWRMPDRNTLASLIAGVWLVAMTLA